MDTRESKTKQEEKMHVRHQRIPEEFGKANSHLQPEAKKRPSLMYKMIPLAVVVLVGLVVAMVVMAVRSGG